MSVETIAMGAEIDSARNEVEEKRGELDMSWLQQPAATFRVEHREDDPAILERLRHNLAEAVMAEEGHFCSPDTLESLVLAVSEFCGNAVANDRLQQRAASVSVGFFEEAIWASVNSTGNAEVAREIDDRLQNPSDLDNTVSERGRGLGIIGMMCEYSQGACGARMAKIRPTPAAEPVDMLQTWVMLPRQPRPPQEFDLDTIDLNRF